jgi:hypothetical protein
MTIQSHPKPYDRHDDDDNELDELDEILGDLSQEVWEFDLPEIEIEIEEIEPVVVEPEPELIPEPVVVSVRYSRVDYMAVITGTFSDGSESEVVRYFSDELSFQDHEFVGKTARECREVFMRRDGAYLRS